MSWKPVVIADSTGDWVGNALRFATKEESDQYASDLAARWLSVREWKSIEDPNQPNYRIVDNKLVHIEAEERERIALGGE